MKKFIISLLIMLGVVALIAGGVFVVYSINTRYVKLDEQKLIDKDNYIDILSETGSKINDNSNSVINENEKISDHLINAFVSVEDKRFFKHNGIDYVRIFGATAKNIKNLSLREGASTITQQLAKNTHLSSEKTFSRKLKEIKLAKQLEKKYSKDDILKMYLNKIYFGNGIYGVKEAAKIYFSKDNISTLTVQEAAFLAGIVKAPSYYTQEKNLSNANDRRNLVLGLMKKEGKITETEYNNAIKTSTTINIKTKQNSYRTYLSEVIKEACDILNCSTEELRSSNLKIETYFSNNFKQLQLEKIAKDNNCNIIAMSMDNATLGITNVFSSVAGNISEIPLMPGSTIKPIIPYACALENGIITPLSFEIDERMTFGDYSPQNFGNIYYGKINIKTAIEKSSNIVAIKTLQKVTCKKAIEFAKNMGLPINDADKNSLAVALGGVTDGISIVNLASSYSTFANYGRYKKASFIKSIKTHDNIVIYENSEDVVPYRQVMSESTAFLMTKMLENVVTNGTASKLSSLPVTVCAKTGTVGNKTHNKAAWTVCYTPHQTIAVWCGCLKNDSLNSNILGGTLPCEIAKQIILKTETENNLNFQPPDDIRLYSLDKYEYEVNNQIVLASDYCNANNKMYEYLPANLNLTSGLDKLPSFIEKSLINFQTKDGFPSIFLPSSSNCVCSIYRKDLKNDYTEKIFSNTDVPKNFNYVDKNVIIGNSYKYYVEYAYNDKKGYVESPVIIPEYKQEKPKKNKFDDFLDKIWDWF